MAKSIRIYKNDELVTQAESIQLAASYLANELDITRAGITQKNTLSSHPFCKAGVFCLFIISKQQAPKSPSTIPPFG